MSPDTGPANENKKLGEPGYLSPRGQRIENAVGLIGIALGIGFMFAVLDAKHWISLGITIGVASVFIVGAAIYRLIFYGRA